MEPLVRKVPYFGTLRTITSDNQQNACILGETKLSLVERYALLRAQR